MIANHDDVLGHHLAGIGLANKNSKYTSPRIQNDIITIIGYDVIRSDLIEEIKAARWFSILADEVTSSNKEELALCYRFVDTNNNIREEFLSFLNLSRITAAVIAGTILDFLKMTGLDATNIRGQGYDGAANMSSDNVGVQRLIKEHSPKSVYVHCSGHCLDLVIAHSCSLPCIRNTTDKLKTCCWFFLASPKRGLLQSIIRKALPEETKHRKGLLDLCKTRWAARHQAYTHFYQAYIYIITALENIVHGANVDACGLDFREAKWDPKCRSDAASLLASLTSFDFIVTFLTIYHFLSHLSGITVKLQGRSVDIIKAYHEISTVKAVYKAICDDVEVEFSRSYKQAVIMASAVSTMSSMLRTVGRQTMRSNVPAATPEEHYRQNVAIPFLSHIQSELDSQFSDLSVLSSKLLGLVPSVLCEDDVPSLEEVVDVYADDMHSPEVFPQELFRWKQRFLPLSPDQRPSMAAAAAMKVCDDDLFPNIFVLLRLCCTIPATSCECERSASALRRLNTHLRASMTFSSRDNAYPL
ncbi:52 kDa repressor of the inhibitor of the protein kinase-like [Gigantopelta aegis]|uniref:52 kDa repressor of the inhibitor of the protein kinase-like n=1 Tax=Gigantopelta aegis TaxID=1735272 RepID=UPI001B88DA65|nr:52 kDa repressor of the inhibitor of the protein kinase-like [Gigantopelta aegis]